MRLKTLLMKVKNRLKKRQNEDRVSKTRPQENIQEKEETHIEWIFFMKDFLEKNNHIISNGLDERVVERRNGRKYSMSEHLKGLIGALLTNQRPWVGIQPHLAKIDIIFYDYDVEKVKSTPGAYFTRELRAIKCGNRNIKSQMNNLSANISMMEKIEEEFGSMDEFVTSAPATEIVKMMSDYNSEYKFKNIGVALAWEYLKNIGIDGAKADVHLYRFFGGDRMGNKNRIPATAQEVYDTVSALSKKSGLSMGMIDSLVWHYCADGFGMICAAVPQCNRCVIESYCKKGLIKQVSHV